MKMPGDFTWRCTLALVSYQSSYPGCQISTYLCLWGNIRTPPFLGTHTLPLAVVLDVPFDLTFESGRSVNSWISSWAALSASRMPPFALSLMAYPLDVLKQYTKQMCLFEFLFKISYLLILSELGQVMIWAYTISTFRNFMLSFT